MPDRINTAPDRTEESAQARRERQSARAVAEWEAAFQAAKAGRDMPPTERPADSTE
jgi:hypothetical protein